MPRFFTTPAALASEPVRITGADAHHMQRVLRLRVGEELTVCDTQGTDCRCVIDAFEDDAVILRVLERTATVSEPTSAITLYQGLPKGDKLEWIIQKAVELGVCRVVPVVTARSIAKIDDKSAAKKQERWQKIAAEAAGQSGRGCIPTVEAPLSWKQALERWKAENVIAFYEGGGRPLDTLVDRSTRQLSIVVGPEGGFAPEEIAALEQAGAHIATLGKRILRCETAPLAALAILMQLTGNME